MEAFRAKVEERYVAVDDVCAWPNIKRLRSGELAAFIYNRPSHGKMEGDIELWVSETGSSPWSYRSTMSRHAPGTVRMNMAAGVLADGTIVGLVSGWDLGFPDPIRTENILPTVQICRSTDSGATWIVAERSFEHDGATRFIPFGSIVEGHGLTAVSMYDCRMSDERSVTRTSSSHLFVSEDGGVGWNHRGVIGRDRLTETDVIAVTDGWLAAARTLGDYANPADPHGKPWVCALRTDLEGVSWDGEANITLPNQHPGNLHRLADGRIVFTCGSRLVGFMGVFARFSSDEGVTWSEPLVIAEDGFSHDMGYPSTVELADGRLLTAYYAKTTRAHQRYHMATAVWTPPPAGAA